MSRANAAPHTTAAANDKINRRTVHFNHIWNNLVEPYCLSRKQVIYIYKTKKTPDN